MIRIIKSIGAVLAGILLVTGLSMGTDAILEYKVISLFVSGTGQLLLALIYRSVYAAMGGYLTAWLAPTPKLRHVMVLGTIGLLLSAVSVIVQWDLGYHWYPIALALTAYPITMWGGKLRTNKSKEDATTSFNSY